MDLTDPTRAITPTLDGPILAVLVRSGRPLTVGDIASEVPRGSEIGVRRAVGRLVEQGIVIATQMGRNVVHELNREHVAAPAADVLAGLRSELWRRLRAELLAWEPKPVYACVYGSAGRGDGDSGSDIDLLLVHRPMLGEKQPPAESKGFWDTLANVVQAAHWVPVLDDGEGWLRQVDDLRGKVRRWTGNPLQTVDLSVWQWAALARSNPELHAAISHDAIDVAGDRLSAELRRIMANG